MANDANTLKAVDLLIEAAKLDTVYRDVHLRRARQLLSSTLDEFAYRALGSAEKEIDDLLRRSRTAVLHRDWAQAADLSGQIEALRQQQAKMRGLAATGKEVYDADAVVFDPFSPGKHMGAQGRAKQAELRTQVMNALASLAKLDSGSGAFYEKRRSYFAGLDVGSAGAGKKDSKLDRSKTELFAHEAAERGDIATLQRLAKQLRDWKESEGAATSGAIAPLSLSRYQCPVDLAAPFPPQVIERARELGLIEVRSGPAAELKRVREVIYAHADQPAPSNPDMEKEGVLRARAQAELELPTELDTEEPRTLAGQFIQQIFVNSGGARYLPPLCEESVLFEDFAENEAADAPSKLLSALGLAKRSGLSRAAIESALIGCGAEILERHLGLDPVEFRLVCIPYDLYARFGGGGSYGKWHHWTHFDGYQVMGGNRLRALVGGDGRFGGLYDLVSISPSDAREGVYARFTVIRRARETLRWR